MRGWRKGARSAGRAGRPRSQSGGLGLQRRWCVERCGRVRSVRAPDPEHHPTTRPSPDRSAGESTRTARSLSWNGWHSSADHQTRSPPIGQQQTDPERTSYSEQISRSGRDRPIQGRTTGPARIRRSGTERPVPHRTTCPEQSNRPGADRSVQSRSARPERTGRGGRRPARHHRPVPVAALAAGAVLLDRAGVDLRRVRARPGRARRRRPDRRPARPEPPRPGAGRVRPAPAAAHGDPERISASSGSVGATGPTGPAPAIGRPPPDPGGARESDDPVGPGGPESGPAPGRDGDPGRQAAGTPLRKVRR
jgi:hypothetical protein